MAFVLYLVRTYIIILMVRFVATNPELSFNPIGRMIGSITNPILPKGLGARIIPLYIAVLVFLTSFLAASTSTLSGQSLSIVLIDYLGFFMSFFTVAIILGSFGNTHMGGGIITYLFRIGLPWVKLARVFVPIKTGKIIYPAIIILFMVYFSMGFLLLTVWSVMESKTLDVFKIIQIVLFLGLNKLIHLIFYLVMVIIARALMSWVSPDPNNPIVQLIYLITEPVLAPARRIIPPIGFLDVSAMVVIMVLYFIYTVLSSLIPAFYVL